MLLWLTRSTVRLASHFSSLFIYLFVFNFTSFIFLWWIPSRIPMWLAILLLSSGQILPGDISALLQRHARRGIEFSFDSFLTEFFSTVKSLFDTFSFSGLTLHFEFEIPFSLTSIYLDLLGFFSTIMNRIESSCILSKWRFGVIFFSTFYVWCLATIAPP